MPEVETPSELRAVLEKGSTTQKAVEYGKETWTAWLSGIPGALLALEALPDSVDRSLVASKVESMWERNTEGAFVTVMAWGYGTKNRGPYRTARVLTQDSYPKGRPLDESVTARLRQSVEVVREKGSVGGFRFLNNYQSETAGYGKIKWLGPAFFTKWLYYASLTGPGGHENPAPILDKRVRDRLKSWDVDLKNDSTRDYERYASLLTEWGREYGMTASEVEQAIFTMGR